MSAEPQANPLNIAGIDHVVLRVSDMPRMLAWYREVLGCRLERGPGELGLAQLRAGVSLIDLVDIAGPLGGNPGKPPDGSAANMDHLCLLIEPWDTGTVLAHLSDHAVEIEDNATRYGATGMGPSIYLRDPEGNRLELKGR